MITLIFSRVSRQLISTATIALLLMGPSRGVGQEKPRVGAQATNIELEQLNSSRLLGMTDDQVIPFYTSRMSSADPNNQWIRLIDSDIMGRPTSGELMLRLLKQPLHRSIRPGVWHWLSDHPDYKTTAPLMNYSLELYQAGISNWRWEDRGAFANYLATSGPPEVAKIIEELALIGGPGVEFAKEKFYKRVPAPSEKKSAIAPSISKPDLLKQESQKSLVGTLAPLPSGQPASGPDAKPKATTPHKEPTSTTPWITIVVLVVFVIGLLWLVLKRRSQGIRIAPDSQ